MNKALLGVVIGILVIIGLVAGLLMYLQAQNPTSTQPTTSSPTNDAEQSSPSTGADTDTVQQSGTVSAEIKNFAFSPSKLTVKKGTTVTWTNQDTTKHNVVASDQANTGGLPTSSALLAKGETFSHTFNEVGTFAYRCAPHPNMTGTVEVVE